MRSRARTGRGHGSLVSIGSRPPVRLEARADIWSSPRRPMADRRPVNNDGRQPKLRCAVYTRKSTEEGLEQDFNSLDAQREACEAYIASQKHEGWVALPTCMTMAAISGGTLERPALQRLLADIERRQGRRRGRLQGRPADPLAARTSPRSSRCSTRTASPSSPSPSSSTPPPRWAG